MSTPEIETDHVTTQIERERWENEKGQGNTWGTAKKIFACSRSSTSTNPARVCGNPIALTG